MRDLDQIELRRETLFKDAVLNAAEMQGMEIIAQAQRESVKTLQAAQAACQQADHESVQTGLERDARRQESALMQDTRRDLLRHRTQLVDRLFAQVEEKLAAFANGKDYAAWLEKKVRQRTEGAADGAGLTVWLRPADMKLEKAVRKVLPGAQVQADADIRIGGVRVSDGYILYDDTLDDALQTEREAFTKSGYLKL